MGLGSFILYLRAHKDGITPREVAAEIGLPEHYIHAIELEKHAGDATSRGKLAEYFDVNVDDFSDYARSTHTRFLELLKKERRPQVGFLLMSGDTLMGTVDGADSSIIKIVELNNGTKTILQRHAIKKWWPLKTRAERPGGFRPGGGDRPRGGPGGDRPRGGPGGPRPSGPGGDRRPPSGPRPGGPGGDRRPPGGPGGPPRPGGGYNQGGSGGYNQGGDRRPPSGPRPNNGGGYTPNGPRPGPNRDS